MTAVETTIATLNPAVRQSVSDFLTLEGMLLDERRWQEWLDLYDEDAEYWVPAWDDEETLTDDPKRQISLIYYESRKGLEDRVYRLETGLSSASTPLPRTCHMTGPCLVEPRRDGEIAVRANWTAHIFRLGSQHHFFGRYEYLLRAEGESWKIRAKKIIVLNDLIPNVLDIYSV